MFVAPTDARGRRRLLPPSLPARCFAAAAAFHLLGWLILARAPGRVVLHAGGPGPGLAALHAFTLGTLTMTAIGVSLQLLPVATVQPVRAIGAAKAVWWLFVASVLAIVAGFEASATRLSAAGGLGAAVALAGHGLLTARQLAAAKRQRALTAAGWGALAALVIVLATGPALAWRLHAGAPALAPETGTLHALAGLGGFLGLQALGVSGLLVPMFMVAKAPSETRQRFVLGASAVAIATTAGLMLAAAPARWLALPGLCAFAAAVAHAHAMLGAIARRRNRDAGELVPMLRIAWVALPAGLAAWIALAFAPASTAIAQAVVVLLAGGWLLGLALGMLLRIAPFLASVHVKLACGTLPPLSVLTPRLPARVLAIAHPLAIGLLLAGVGLGDGHCVRAAGASGVVSAGALIAFLAGVWMRARRAAVVPPES